MKEKTIIIVGGGQAAAMAAASLRQQGFTGELHLFSDERHLPYERPPLSKSMLLEDSPQLQQVFCTNLLKLPKSQVVFIEKLSLI